MKTTEQMNIFYSKYFKIFFKLPLLINNITQILCKRFLPPLYSDKSYSNWVAELELEPRNIASYF